jgi:amino acid transporter
MRYTHEDIPRSFRVPFGPWLVPIVGILLCILLLINTSGGTAIRFGIWMAIGHIIYFSYGFWHSKARLQKQEDSCASMNKLVPTEVFVMSYASKTNLESESTDEYSPVVRL